MSRSGKRKRNKIGEQFIAYPVRMLESPAWRVLTLAAHRVVDRIAIEQAHHGGAENGRLPVTYDNFEHYGIHRHSINPAIKEVEALGIVEITERGYAGNADFRSPNKFRLTFLCAGGASPTNDWERIKTIEEAQAIAKQARRAFKLTGSKNTKPVANSANFQCRKQPLKPKIPNAGNHHYSRGT